MNRDFFLIEAAADLESVELSRLGAEQIYRHDSTQSCCLSRLFLEAHLGINHLVTRGPGS